MQSVDFAKRWIVVQCVPYASFHLICVCTDVGFEQLFSLHLPSDAEAVPNKVAPLVTLDRREDIAPSSLVRKLNPGAGLVTHASKLSSHYDQEEEVAWRFVSGKPQESFGIENYIEDHEDIELVISSIKKKLYKQLQSKGKYHVKATLQLS